ncbi:MAG: hypothetical protein LC808_26705 [Actinobacteria bacterium]|nr:hypothetical protein [Actinomycetota bacterium]
MNPNAQWHEYGAFEGFANLSQPGTPSIFLSGNRGWNQTNPNGNQWALANEVNDEGGGDIGPVPQSWRRSSPMANTAFPITAQDVNTLESTLLPAGTPKSVGAGARLDCNGNWVNNRDSQEVKLINQYGTGPTSVGTGNNFIGDNEADYGGYPTIATGDPCPDADLDGMPDAWENANGLNPNNAADRNATDTTGFTELEVYLAGNDTAAPPPSAAPTVSILDQRMGPR